MVYNPPVHVREEEPMKIGGMSLMGFGGVVVLLLVIALLVLGVIALVKYIRKK